MRSYLCKLQINTLLSMYDYPNSTKYNLHVSILNDIFVNNNKHSHLNKQENSYVLNILVGIYLTQI